MIDSIGEYRLVQPLGSGYFGHVWKAEGTDGKVWALKLVSCDWPQGKSSPGEIAFKTLAKIQTIRHPCLLILERLTLVDNQLLLVMELAEKSLWDRFRECRAQGLSGIPPAELRGYIKEAAEIIDLMNSQHQAPHWDLKPRNILLVGGHVKVGDFGQVADLQILKAGHKGGSNPVYSAPEVFDGQASAFSDQYSLVLLYQELLTGERPFLANTVYQLMTQHLHAQPNPSGLPERDQQAIRRALSKKPDLRFSCCLDFVNALSPVEKLAVEPEKPATASPEVAIAGAPGAAAMRPASSAVTRLAATPSTSRPIKPAPDVPAIEEIQGDGVLVPALVIGVGRTALGMLHRVRATLVERFGSLDRLPNIRWLYIDTDPAGASAAQEGVPGVVLTSQEILLTRLSTTDHYAKGVSLRVPVSSWLNPLMLYRIPRTLLTGGIRALGRLALLEHYPAIVQRLRDELKACSHPKALATAAKNTRLSQRSNRPQVYLAAHLAGGTGSGMFIDLAYLTRDVLKHMGYPAASIDGLFWLPAPDGRPEKPAYFGNTVAALKELNRFTSAGAQFQADYGDAEGVLADPAPPFHQCFFLPGSVEEGKESTRRATELASGYVYANLVTPLGRAADACREKLASGSEPGASATGLTRPVAHAPGSDITHHSPLTTHHAFGMYRFSWPKRTMMQQAARRLCRKLVERWVGHVNPGAEMVRVWLAEEWSKRGLEPQRLLARLEEGCEKTWKKKPEDVLMAISGQFMAENAPKLDGAIAENAIAHVEQLAGKPRFKPKPGQSKPVPAPPSVIERTLSEGTRALSTECEKELADLCVCALDEPGFRLAGAELAVPQILNLIDTLERKEGEHREALAETSEVAYDRMQTLAGSLEGLGAFLRRGNIVAELVQFFYLYPKARYQELTREGVLSVIRALRNAYGRFSQDIGMCRKRLMEFRHSLHSLQPFKESAGGVGPGISILPVGCAKLEEAVDQFVKAIPEQDLLDLDRQVQEAVKNKMKSLVSICLSSQASQLLGELEMLMQMYAEKFVAARMHETDAADFFLKQYQNEEEIAKDIAGAFHQATPEIHPADSSFRAREMERTRTDESQPGDFHVLGVPAGAAGERFAEHARNTMKDIDLTVAAGTDDILFYRESALPSLDDLPQLGPKFQQAYQEISAQQNFTPHSREDITNW
jgi:hypothetical protein